MSRLGMAPIGWLNGDRPEISAHISVDQCLSEVREIGFEGVELCAGMPTGIDTLRAKLDQHGLRLISGWYPGELTRRSVAQEKDAIADQLALFKALGAPVMVFAETAGSVQSEDVPVSTRPRLSDDAWSDYGRKVTEMAEWLAEQGVPMGFHHHMGTAVESEADIDNLMNHTGEAVKLLLDTGHAHFAGADIDGVARRWAHRINHVHVKDVRPQVLADFRARDRSFLDGVLDGVFTVPGDGCIDYVSVFRILADAGYDGWVMIEAEQDPKKADPKTYSRLGMRHALDSAEKAGFALGL
ncbi:MAG: myo-inosose-2 dehydratase [Alphaproteobacteria bacterium]